MGRKDTLHHSIKRCLPKKYLKIKAQVCVWVCTSVCDCGTDCDGKKTVYTKFEREWKIVYVCICVK